MRFIGRVLSTGRGDTSGRRQRDLGTYPAGYPSGRYPRDTCESRSTSPTELRKTELGYAHSHTSLFLCFAKEHFVKVSRSHACSLSLSLSLFLKRFQIAVVFTRHSHNQKNLSRKIDKITGDGFSSSRVDSKLLLVGDSADWLVELWRVFINMIIIQYVYDVSR